MTLPWSGQITGGMIASEFKRSKPFYISQYHRGQGIVPINASTANISTGGYIAYSMFRGAQNQRSAGEMASMSGNIASYSRSMISPAGNFANGIWQNTHQPGPNPNAQYVYVPPHYYSQGKVDGWTQGYWTYNPPQWYDTDPDWSGGVMPEYWTFYNDSDAETDPWCTIVVAGAAMNCSGISATNIWGGGIGLNLVANYTGGSGSSNSAQVLVYQANIDRKYVRQIYTYLVRTAAGQNNGCSSGVCIFPGQLSPVLAQYQPGAGGFYTYYGWFEVLVGARGDMDWARDSTIYGGFPAASYGYHWYSSGTISFIVGNQTGTYYFGNNPQTTVGGCNAYRIALSR